MKQKKKTYEVLAWDVSKQIFTPQIGVRRGPYSQFALRRAHRSGAPSVLIRER